MLNDFLTVSLFHGASAVRNESIQNSAQILLISRLQLSLLSNFL